MSLRDDDFRPIIFPLSNPTSKSEATIDEVMKYTNFKAIFGAGSPYKNIIHNGNIIWAN